MAETFIGELIASPVKKLVCKGWKGIKTVVNLESEVKSLQETMTIIEALLFDLDSMPEHSHVQQVFRKMLSLEHERIADFLDALNNRAGMDRKICLFSFARIKAARKVKSIRKKLSSITDNAKFGSIISCLPSATKTLACGAQTVASPNITDVADSDSIYAASIIEIAGVGNREVARQLFNDERVNHHFDVKIWYSEYSHFNLMEALEEMTAAEKTLYMKQFVGMKFLLVLDDIWDDDFQKMVSNLRILLSVGAQGSRVILTTRHKKASDTIHSISLSQTVNESDAQLDNRLKSPQLSKIIQPSSHEHLPFEHVLYPSHQFNPLYVSHLCSSEPPLSFNSALESYIPISEAELLSLISPWSSAIIIKVIGGSFEVSESLKKLWQPSGSLEFLALSRGFYNVVPSQASDRDRILAGGPWFLLSHFVYVQPWEPGFQPAKAKVSSAAVWLSLPELPIEFHRLEFLSKIGNSLGYFVGADTSEAESVKLIVLMDLSIPLKNSVWIGNFNQPIDYVKVPDFCNHCQVVRHPTHACLIPAFPRDEKRVENPIIQDEEIHKGVVEAYGAISEILAKLVLKDEKRQVARSSQVKTPITIPISNSMFNVDILPHELRLIYMYAKKLKENEQIMIPVDEAVVNQSHQIFLGKEELFELLAQQEIGACHMTPFIMLLHRNCQESGKSNFGFLCPSTISLVVQSRFRKKIQENREERSRYINNVFQATSRNGKVFLAPYNAGHHWILCVVDPYANVVYYLDPLRDEGLPIGDDLRSVVELALLLYQSQVGENKKLKNKTKWSRIQCPRQTNDVDCGYYVLRFMREIIDHDQQHIPEKYFPDCSWPNYSINQIDEVRTELTRHILSFAI